MIRESRCLLLASALALLAPPAWADEQQVMQELREVRALLEQQGKQIDALTTQVARLNQLLSAKGTPAPAADAFSEAPRAEAVARTEPAVEGQRHIIVKGDNLTSIAKHYNVSLSELQKANKGLNPSKLQIGQTVIIPQKTSDQPAEKKETP